MRPLAIDLYTGLHGWAEGLIDAGFHVVGFDLVDMSRELGVPKPDHFNLVIQDVLTLHGRQFKDARLLVGSSPCTTYSYMAMPWSRAKTLAAWYREDPARQVELNALYDAQFRIQREASEAAGRHIPLVVENVRGAEKWVGRARWAFGSYLLWGDVPALMPPLSRARKVPGFRFDGSGRSFQTASVNTMKPPARVSEKEPDEGRKGAGAGAVWFDQNTSSLPSGSPRRRAASAKIAKIPFVLASWIGRTYYEAAS